MKNKRDETKIEQDLRQIADMLLLNGTLVSCPGLLNGKIGIAVFFFHYAQHTRNELFEDYAVDLIGLIHEQIHANSPSDYETGLAGIGIAIKVENMSSIDSSTIAWILFCINLVVIYMMALMEG